MKTKLILVLVATGFLFVVGIGGREYFLKTPAFEVIVLDMRTNQPISGIEAWVIWYRTPKFDFTLSGPTYQVRSQFSLSGDGSIRIPSEMFARFRGLSKLTVSLRVPEHEQVNVEVKSEPKLVTAGPDNSAVLLENHPGLQRITVRPRTLEDSIVSHHEGSWVGIPFYGTRTLLSVYFSAGQPARKDGVK